jgi:uncharacterized membrane protein
MVLNRKSLYKTISWRIVSIILSFTLSYVLMGSIEAATTFTVIYNVIATVLYYLHEMFYKWLRRKGII